MKGAGVHFGMAVVVVERGCCYGRDTSNEIALWTGTAFWLSRA